jgi:hypothetical protein
MTDRTDEGLWEAERVDDDVRVTLAYPRSSGEAKAVILTLMDVRGADDLRVTYDFERDGWSISTDATPDDPGAPVTWSEVAFIETKVTIRCRCEPLP